MPMPGDVDIVLASELMEAARAVERGFVTPDRTLLIASTHRVFAMTEKIALADGRVDAAALLAGCSEAAREMVAFDMAALADATGSALSAVLFGALAGSAALPFPARAFEAAIRRGQVGVAASLAAFAAAFEAARDRRRRSCRRRRRDPRRGSRAQADRRTCWRARNATFRARPAARDRAAIERLNDYQDADYAKDFLAASNPSATSSGSPETAAAARGNRAPARARHGLRGHHPGGGSQDPRQPLRAGAEGGSDRGRPGARDRRILPPPHAGDRGYPSGGNGTLAPAQRLGAPARRSPGPQRQGSSRRPRSTASCCFMHCRSSDRCAAARFALPPNSPRIASVARSRRRNRAHRLLRSRSRWRACAAW